MKTKNKLISVVLTLALLCPMLSFVLPLEANAALAPDDGVSNASSSNSIYEEWTFDDLDDGEAVTQGYIDSHINGSFDASMFKDTWTAVTDADSGRKYIRSSNSYFRLSDPGLLLLKNPYEVSFDLMVDSSSNNTDTSMLLWCNDGEGDGARHALLRYKAASGDIGYYTTSATSNKTGESYAASNAVPKGEWHNVRVRVVPSTGLVVLWVDGEYRFHYVNEYLKANAASSEHSALFVWYTWDSGRTACLDNIKITDVKVDENIEFKPYTPVAVGGEWNYNSGTIENGTGITASLGNTTGHLGTKTGVSNDTGMYYLDSSSSNQFEGLRFIFDEPLVNFDKVNISYRTYFVSAPMWTNMFYFKNASGSYKTMLRINPMTGTADQMRWRNANDGETNTGNKMVTGVWYTVNLSITPYTGIVDVTVTPDTGTAWSFQATRTDIKDLCNSDGVLDFYLYRQSGTRAEMCIDDVKITTARLTKDTEGSWNFDSQSLASISGFSAPDTDQMKYVADPSVTLAEGQTATDYVLKTEYNVNTNYSPYGPDITFDERLKNYESVTISFKIRYDAASNLTNLIRFKNASDKQKVLLRVGSYSNNLALSYRNGSFTTKSDGSTSDNTYAMYNGSARAQFAKNAWNDVSITIIPATGDFTVSLGGSALRASSNGSTTFNNSLIKELYDNNKSLSFQLYYHSGMMADTYIDDFTVTAKRVTGDLPTTEELINAEFIDPSFSLIEPELAVRNYDEWEIVENKYHSKYEQNYIIKTLEGDDGKPLSTLAIADSARYLANHPFEVSFDYCMNQKPGYINLLRANINGTWFSLLRVTNSGILTNYTSAGYAQITSPSATSGKNLSLNVTGDKTLTAGKWYNIRVVMNPLNGHVMCYLDNTLVSDYNLNEVYTDSNGASLGVCDDLGANNPDKVIVEIAAASSDVSVNDSCLDNLRIRTLERREYKKTLIGKAEFDDLTANSALTPDSFMLTSGGIYTTAVTDGFTVKGSELGNYLLADVSAGMAIDIGLTTDYNPLAAGVVAFEGNFNISSFGSEGTLDLISLSRDGADALRILAVDHEGKLYMGTETNALYTLKEDELYTLKVLMSGASGLLTLYVNGDLITAGVSMGITAAPKLSYTDDMGTTLTYNNERFEAYFAYDEGAKRKTFSGLDLYEAELADFTSVSWPQDTLKILGVTGAGSWQVIADDISLTRDGYADLYYNNYENISALHGTSASTYGSYVEGMKLDKEDSNGFATMNGTTGGGRVGFWDNNSILWGNDFVAQMDVRLNSLPESEYYNLFALVTGTAPGNKANWGSLLRLGADGTLYKPEKESGAYVSIGKQIPTKEWVNIAVVVSVDPWESPVKDTNRPVAVKVYVKNEQVATYTARNITHMFDTLLRFCVEGSGKAIDIDIDNTRVYYGTTPRNNDLAPGAGDTAFDGYNAITIDFEDENFFAKAEMNAIDYLDWNYSPCGTTLVDKNGATVTLSEKVTSGDNSFFRMRRPSYGGSTSDKPVAYMDYNLGTFGDYGEVYSIEMDVRYTDTLGSSMNVVELFERNLTGSTVLLSILGTNDTHSNAYYFENDGIRYFLCNSSGKLLNVNPAGDGEFSEIGLVINEIEGYYSIWIDGVGAYYYADGGTSGEVVSAHKVPLEYEKQPSATICDPVARLLKATDNYGSNSIIDIDNISIDIIKNGIAPVMSLYTQSGELGNAIRFIATVDTLYTNAVGFDVEIVSTISGTKKDSRESNIVYSSIKEKVGDKYFDVIAAEDERINGRYISVISIENLHTDIYEFSVTPYVIVFGEKISGASQTYSFNCETGTSSNE